MSDLSVCVSGCTVRDRHRTDCPCTGDHDRDHDGHCRGCQPRAAEYGRLCPWCWQRLNADVVDAPELVRHLRAMALPHAGRRGYDASTGHGDPAETPILSAAIDTADEIHAMLASWAHLVLDEHPDGDQMRGPDETGTVRTETVAILDSDIARTYGGPYLRRSTIAGIRDPGATERLVRWLLPQLRWCSSQAWAGEMRREISSAIHTALARWPVMDRRSRAIAGVRCVSCGNISLAYSPTAGPRLPFHVACTHPDCGRLYTEAEYDGAIGRLTAQRGYIA